MREASSSWIRLL